MRNLDNLKYYSDNLAHDYDMFMPKQKPQAEEEDDMASLLAEL